MSVLRTRHLPPILTEPRAKIIGDEDDDLDTMDDEEPETPVTPATRMLVEFAAGPCRVRRTDTAI